MSNISMEKRLELVKQVRSQYQRNQYDMSNREQILYGRTAMAEEGGGFQEGVDNRQETRPRSSFRLRLFLAVLLAAGVIFLKENEIEIAGIAMEEVFQAISADYYNNVSELAETLSQH